MGKVTVELDWETIDNIVLQELKNTRDGLVRDLERVKEKGKGDVFDLDLAVDIPLIEKHIEACDLIYKYYGGR
jgi:hypothetical protein